LFYRADVLIFQALHLTKSWIAEKAIEAQRAARIVELENDKAQLSAEIDATRSKLAEVEGHEWALNSTYDEVKKGFNDLSSLHDVVLKEKSETDTMVQQFQDSLHKRLVELRRETKDSVAALGGRCAEFPTNASVSDFLGWFQTEIAVMPTAFTECNENITCYALIGLIQMLVGEGYEHVSKLKKLALSCDASLIQEFPADVGRTTRKLVKHWWTNHGLPYCMQKIEEENQVSSAILLFW
jgi:hypothetical protein